MAPVAMPEAAMNEDHGLPFRKDHVGPSGECGVKTKTKSGFVEPFSEDDLGFCVLSSYARHHPASDFGRNNVSHWRREGLAIVL